MQIFTSTSLSLALATLSSTVLAAPAPTTNAKSMMAESPEWTIRSFTRNCFADDTTCTYSFTVDRNDGTNAPVCKYDVVGSPASQAPANGETCGDFTVSSSWSPQFGPGNGFTTLAVKDQTNIVFPAYTDTQLADGVTVTPDQSYAPQVLPQ